ncbi:MAG: amidohydrolase family protein, partial [Thermoprotei archaeon]
MYVCLRGFIITMSERYGLVSDGLLVFNESTGLIEDITRWNKKSSVRCDFVEGGEYAIVMPGLINTHTHAPMLILQGLGAGLSGFDWLRKIWCIEGLLKPEHIYLSAKVSILLMLENGITTFADHYFHEEEVARAVDELGARGVLAKTVIEYSEHAPKHTIEDSLNFATRFNKAANDRIRTMIGVHAMYSCSTETLLRAVEFYEKYGVRIHMHFSESLHELDYVKNKYNTTPTGLARKLGILKTKPLLAHATYLDNEDIKILSNHEVYV